MIKYKILVNASSSPQECAEELSEIINDHVDKGWELVGNMTHCVGVGGPGQDYTEMAQMVRRVE